MGATVPRHALLLAAGLGTRLRPLTLVRAKPAVPIAGEPVARRILAWLQAHGVRHLTVNLHHLPPTVTAILGDGSDLHVSVRYSWEGPTVLGSAGGPRHALDLIDAETFWMINGDTLTNPDLAAMAERHASSGALVTLALVPSREPGRYGGVRVDERGRVVGFVARGSAAEDTWHFPGVQIVNAAVFRALPEGTPASSIGGVYDALLAAKPGAIAGYLYDAPHWDIGTVPDYLAASRAFAQAEGRSAAASGPRTTIHPSAQVVDSILWNDIEIGPDCRLAGCIVTDGVRVPAGAVYEHAALLRADLAEARGGTPDRRPRAFPLAGHL